MKNFRLLSLGLLFLLYSSSHIRHSGSLSLSFEENRGQGPADARFLARAQKYNIALTPAGNRVVLRSGGRGLSVGTELVGANSESVIRGEDKQVGRVNYLRGRSSLTDIPTYARVRYQRVYPGIDLVYYGNERQLEYDFVVKPGADPKRIALRFDGVEDASLDSQGNLVLRASGSEIVQHKPVVYQRSLNVQREVEGRYRLMAENTVSFELGDYDRNAELVIDPVLSYSTFLGGSNGDDDARAVTTDSAGNIYITGSTTATNFPTVFPLQGAPGSLDPTLGLSDAFVTKLNPAGTAMIYSTYLGGSNDEDSNAIAVDSNGNVAITGSTVSTDFPTTGGALRRTCNSGPGGCLDAFVAEINPSGSFLIFSTYLGGTGDDVGRGVTFDSSGNSYVTGGTDSQDFMTTPLAYSTDPSAGGFVVKLSPAGTVVFSTYFGSVFGSADPRAIAIDTFNNVYIAGGLDAGGTGTDVFISKLNPAGTSLLYTQTIRGSKDETANAIAVDAAGNAYVTGQTSSLNFPTTSGAVQSAFGGGPAFRISDVGSTFSVNFSRSGITRTSLYALAIAPGTPTTLYAGGDDEVAGGVFKSTNGGDSWTSINTGIFDSRVHALAVDPTSPATVYAGTRTLGVYKSTNGGTNWAITALNNVFVTALAIDVNSPTTIYAGTDANGVYKSTNSGTTWSSTNNGLVTTPIRSVVVDPNSSSTVYAATSVGVYKSTNAGSSWAPSSSGLFDPNVNVLLMDPRTPNSVFAGTNAVGVFRSPNGGGIWGSANGGLTSSSSGISVSALALDPSTGTFYAAAGEGNAMRLYKSPNGTNWTATGFTSVRVSGLAPDRNSPGTLYAATLGGTDAFIAKWNASGSLAYSTYLGGSRDDIGNSIALDAGGGMYVAGSTSSTNLPTINALQSVFGGGSGVVSDAFAAKVNPGGDLGFLTYLGGSSDDFGKGIAVDASNTTYVVGVTASADFPITSALTPNRPGLLDAFVVKMGEGSAVSYSVPVLGGFAATSQGGGPLAVGFARIQQSVGGAFPSGLAIFGLRQNNVLVGEAAVPSSAAITTGRIYAEVAGVVNTGIAMANPNPTSTTVSYYFTDVNGQDFNAGSISIPPNGQISAFLNQSAFNGGSSVFGSFTFTAPQPVAVIALRGFTNERGEFLITTLPVADLSAVPDSDPILFPHFADGAGWATQILLVNRTNSTLTGTVQFGGQAAQNYSIAARSAAKVATPGTAAGLLTGAVRVTPASGSNTPLGVAVFSFKNAGITVTEAGVPALRSGTAFRLYAESSGTDGQIGSIQTGIALANPSSNSINVTLELRTITGISTGLSTSMVLPGNGQAAMFLAQIPGFAGLPNPFQGVLRVSTAAASGVAVVGLRGRYNERRDFLITTTQPTNEGAPLFVSEQFFPHLADGGGYTTQFILFNGAGDQPSSGILRFFSQNGQALTLGVR